MKEITWNEFEQVELRTGTIINAEIFTEARRPAYKLVIDFGEKIGTRKSSAQITDVYTPENLIGKQILGVINFPKKPIGKFISECLVTGLIQENGSVILAVPDSKVENGLKLA